MDINTRNWVGEKQERNLVDHFPKSKSELTQSSEETHQEKPRCRSRHNGNKRRLLGLRLKAVGKSRITRTHRRVLFGPIQVVP